MENITQDLEFVREGIFTRRLEMLKFGNQKVGLLLCGRADKIRRTRGTLIVEESKYPEKTEKFLTKTEPYDDQKLQTLLYLNSRFSEDTSLNRNDWVDIPHEAKVWIINIKDKQTGETVKSFRGTQTKETKEVLHQKLSRFALVALRKADPEHHGNVRKCRSCRFLDDCEYKITC